MQPSSLIFLVIIGIWAAYFVQYWVRRREHLATIRSVDAFSETMRVLQLRTPLPTVETGGQAPRTYAVSPARAMRPQVTVKRAQAHTPQHDESTTAAAPAAAPPRQRALPVREIEPEVATMYPSRATRGIVLVVGVLGTVAFGVLAALGVLMVWAPLVPLAMAAAGFGWLRAGVRAETRDRHEARRAVQQRRARQASTAPRSGAATTRPAASASAVVAPSGAAGPSEAKAEQASEAPFDVSLRTNAPETVAVEAHPVVEPVEAGPVEAEPVLEQPVVAHEVALPEVDEDDIPLTWDPRPVPRPTYTMKARAPERPAPRAQVEQVDEDERTAYDELPQRRISGL